MAPTSNSSSSSRTMPRLPAGFRFHPTDEELIVHYLMNQASSTPCPVRIIAEVNIYRCNPWELPRKALFGDNEWYFFSPRDRKYPNGARPNRAAGEGYWKATGTDKAILSGSPPTGENVVGVKKALVFYRGKPPKGVKTDWIMHEYRLTAPPGGNSNSNNTKRRGSSSSSSSMRLDDWVLCRIHKKSNNFIQPFADQEQEGSTVEEDSTTSSLHNSNTNIINSPKSEEEAAQHDAVVVTAAAPTTSTTTNMTTTAMMMSKSCSLTDLLNTIDYSTLSQLLLDAPPPFAETDHHEPQQSPPLIYDTTPPFLHQQPLNNVMTNSYSTNTTAPQLGDADCYGAGYNYNNDLKRKRIMTTTTTDGGGGASSSSSFDDGSSSGFTKKLQLPSDSRSNSSSFFVGTSSSSSYCQEAAASSFPQQYSSGLLPSHPFLLNQHMLVNNHLEMQQ